MCRKIVDLYLMKIQISSHVQKNFKSIFNEYTNQFVMQKNFKSVFTENTNLFFFVVLLKKMFLVVYCKSQNLKQNQILNLDMLIKF